MDRSLSTEAHRIEAWDDGDLEEIARFYEPIAARHDGLLSRTADWWAERVLAPSHGRVPYRYLARRGDEIVGYLVYTHEPAPEHHEYAFELACRDFHWRDPAAAAALLEFVAGHAGMGVSMSWIGPPEDPIELLLTGQQPAIRKRLLAMGRLVHLPAAIEGRGYPEGLTATLELDVSDDVLEENGGPLKIDFEGGEARAALGGGGGLPVDIRALAALYTGWLDPATAAAIGLLPGADGRAIETLRAAFGGPAPWMAEAY